MADRYILVHIRNLPLLANFTAEQLELIAPAFEIIRLQPNELVFRQGQPAQGLYLLTQGQAVLFQMAGADQRILAQVVENQYVGEAALFRGLNERMSMQVTQPSIILFMPRTKFHEVLLQHPSLRASLNSEFAVPGARTAAPQFKGQRENEQLLLRQQRHPWVFVRGLILPLLLSLGLFIAAFTLGPTALTLVFIALALVVPGAWIYYLYVEWQNDFIIITDERVIRTERTLLSFENNISEIPISSVHEVSYNIPPHDIFARILRYGTIFVKTAGESGNMTLTLVPNPEQMQQILLTDKLNHNRNVELQDREAISKVLDDFLKPGDHNPQAPPQEEADHPPQETRSGFFSTRFTDPQGNVVYRKHLSVWLGNIVIPALLLLIALVLTLVGLMGGNLLGGIEVFVGLFVGLIGVVWFYWGDWDWRNDMIVIGVNTVRIVHRRPLWLQDTNEQFLLTQVDNVETKRKGIIDTLLNRGDALVALVGDDKPKLFRNVGNPDEVQGEIFEHRATLLKRQKDEEMLEQRQEIARYLDVYHQKVRGLSDQQAPPPQSGYSPPGFPPSSNQMPGQGGSRPPRVPRSRGDSS